MSRRGRFGAHGRRSLFIGPQGASGGGGGPVEFIDTATRANHASSFGIADNGMPYVNLLGSGGIDNNQFFGSAQPVVEVVDPGIADGEFAVVHSIFDPGEYAGVLFRCTDGTNYHQVVSDSTDTYHQKCETNVTSTIAFGPNGGILASDEISSLSEGAAHSIRKNGVELFPSTSAFNDTATRIAPRFILGSGTGRITSLRATPV